MMFLAGNVYLWGRTSQNLFLVQCLGPAMREIQDKGLASGFWFDRFDARGPHIFFFTRPRDFSAVREHLAGRLEAFMTTCPAGEELTLAELEEGHRQVIGKTFCAADKLPGFAANNTFLLFEHNSTDYPFRIAAHLHDASVFWSLLDDVSLWAIRNLEPCLDGLPVAAGIRWVAALDGALREAGVARDYWRYHAATLLPGLAGREDDRQVVCSLVGTVRGRNRETFERLWTDVETSGPPWPHVSRLVEVALSGDRPDRRFAALREAAHCTLKQLGIPVNQHVPLILFAWGNHLEP